jgi:hypothetical protein
MHTQGSDHDRRARSRLAQAALLSDTPIAVYVTPPASLPHPSADGCTCAGILQILPTGRPRRSPPAAAEGPPMCEPLVRLERLTRSSEKPVRITAICCGSQDETGLMRGSGERAADSSGCTAHYGNRSAVPSPDLPSARQRTTGRTKSCHGRHSAGHGRRSPPMPMWTKRPDNARAAGAHSGPHDPAAGAQPRARAAGLSSCLTWVDNPAFLPDYSVIVVSSTAVRVPSTTTMPLSVT